MIIEIGDIIIDKIKTLPFIDKYAGVVKPIKYKATTKGAVEKTFPAACRTTFAECESGRYLDLVPDSSKKSVVYLESGPARLISRSGPISKWQASYDLIAWLNMPKLGFEGCSYSSIAIMGILDKLPDVPFNIPNKYQQVKITVTGERSKGEDPFLKYKYDETVKQYLMYPYDHFGLNLTVDFNVDKRCVTTAPVGTEIECP
jgi:hypothetical protein